MNVSDSTNRWLVTGYLLIGVAAAWLGINTFKAHSAAQPPRLRAGELIEALPSASTHVADLPTVTVVFRLSDCGGMVERLRVWNTAVKAGTARIEGVVVDTPNDSAQVREVLGGSGIAFPIVALHDPTALRALSAIGHAQTPTALVFDSERRLRMVVPIDTTFHEQQVREIVHFADDVQRIRATTVAAKPTLP